MAARSYSARGIVVGKTKLGETDSIITFLAEDGSGIRAVAKGARKPGGAFASRLELCSTVDLLLARGKSLDVVQEARIVHAHAGLRANPDRQLCANPVAELFAKTMQEGLENPRLFDLADAALGKMESSSVRTAVALCAATLLKTMAFMGFKPSFDTCISCGGAIELGKPEEKVLVSLAEGGSLCPSCAHSFDVVALNGAVLGWAQALLYATFDEIGQFELSEQILFELLQLSRQWVSIHAGVRLKSLDFLMTSGVVDIEAG